MRPLPAATLAVSVALAVLLLGLALWPGLDLSISRTIYDWQGGNFGIRWDPALMAARDVGFYLPVAVLAVVILGWLAGFAIPGTRLSVGGRAVLFLAASFALGPGLLVNGVLKDISHRPRPAQTATLGGTDSFEPWYSFAGQCAKNCSFASGEVAGAAWLAAPAMLAPPGWRAAAMAAAGLFALATAALRLAFGGHFASDVIAGALVTLLSLILVGRLLRGAASKPENPGGGAAQD